MILPRRGATQEPSRALTGPRPYVEVNLSAEPCVDFATRLVEYCGLDPATVRYEVL